MFEGLLIQKHRLPNQFSASVFGEASAEESGQAFGGVFEVYSGAEEGDVEDIDVGG